MPHWSWAVEWVLTALTLPRSSVKAVLTYSKQLEAKATWNCVCTKYKLRFQGTKVMHWQQLHWKQSTESGSQQYLEFTPIKPSPWKQSRKQQCVILRICAWGRGCPAELHTSALQLELHTAHTATASSSEPYGFNQSTRGSSQTPASSVTSAGMPKGYLLASLWGSPVGLSSSNKQVINWLPLQNRVWIHCLRTKASGVNLSKRWAMDSYPGSSTVNLLLPLQLFIIIEAFSKRGILPISHYHNLNNLQYNLFHDRIWAGLPLPQAFRYTNKLLTAHLHFNSIYSLYTNSNLYQVI